MGFIERLFKKVEEVNTGQASPESLAEDMYIGETVSEEEALQYWHTMQQGLLVNAVKAASQEIERAFVLVNFKENEETFDLFYQVDGRLLRWQELGEEAQYKIEQQLLPQASEVARAVHADFEGAGLPCIAYAMLQFEQATMAWFGRRLAQATPEANLTFEAFSNQWFGLLERSIGDVPLDSDRPLPYLELE
ncbi:hypothetical protein BVE84_03505 [Streptococcus azizii]|uniref:Uncharacterized protein n=1 Tax=Streptococcus azizii TaxID=1579424 RepID=A0AB36JRN1_9STRE|nr:MULTISPECIES: hypothetical protein [Streptococcus]MBF0775724.1 hypothetical protein [Streptococcus sp. 19428wD3_AN2]ONK28636.1 hypothetical protein BVE86_02785 [Streptococcus azizii]ONK29331.1 hypothetical protein BVE85_03510 [Streptococcus azizii]ONK30321.1 hypothetical protein BVE84_03505 [Streptococcus azizii]TFU84270.1 hypothetical protein E4T83_02925 [Streptococcus sp. AN2]